MFVAKCSIAIFQANLVTDHASDDRRYLNLLLDFSTHAALHEHRPQLSEMLASRA